MWSVVCKNWQKSRLDVTLLLSNNTKASGTMNRIIIFRRSMESLRRGMSTTGTPKPPVAETPSPAAAAPENVGNPSRMLNARFRPSNFEKFVLVWTKKFKSKEEVPDFVSADLIERSRSQARIKISNILIFLTALASFGAIIAGKAAAKRGDSVHQMNLDWHKSYQDEHKAKETTAAK